MAFSVGSQGVSHHRLHVGNGISKSALERFARMHDVLSTTEVEEGTRCVMVVRTVGGSSRSRAYTFGALFYFNYV